MKFKTMCRVSGAVSAATGLFCHYTEHVYFSDPLLMRLIQDDNPMYKTIAAGLYAGGAFAGLVGSLFVIDGVSDMYTGMHHSGGLFMWKALTRNEERKKKIDRDIEKMRAMADTEPPTLRDIVSSNSK